MKKTKMPAVPDATKLTQQQKQMSDATAADNRWQNNVDINGPSGSIKWTKDADGRMTQNVTLSPEQQNALNSQYKATSDLFGLASNMVGNVSGDPFKIPTGLPTRLTGLDTSGMKNLNSTDYGAARDAYTKAMYDRSMELLDPEFDQQNSKAEQFLSDRGIPFLDQGNGAATGYRNNIARTQNSQRRAAARDAIQMGAAEQSRLFGLDQATNENILRNQMTDAGFRDNARDKGIEEAYQEYNAPLERIRQLFGSTPGLDIMNPSGFNGFASQGGDIAGNTWNQYNANMEQAKQKAADQNALTNSLFGLAGTAGKIWAGGGFG